MKNKQKAVRCSETWSVLWPGHGNAVLKHRRCRRKTRHQSGKCYQHMTYAESLSSRGAGKAQR